MAKAIITVGLGFGDEGKGATVDYLCRHLHADLVVRYCGGSQAGHNVQLSNGHRHTFSQFGSGTFANVPTYLGKNVIINIEALHKEATELIAYTSIPRTIHYNPFKKLIIHPKALVSTVYHRSLNKLRELSRGEHRHGSCGHGIGETRSYWFKYGDDALFAGDLLNHNVTYDKLELIRQRLHQEAQTLLNNTIYGRDVINADEASKYPIQSLSSKFVTDNLINLAKPIKLSYELPEYKTAIFEGAQGTLLDEWHGFHPYTTWSTVTKFPAMEMIESDTEICVLGLIRSYMTRHGAGPLPTHDKDLCASNIFSCINDDIGNPYNEWQGSIRNGYLDIELIKYAIKVNDGIDGLVISHLDQYPGKICTSYNRKDLSNKGIPIAQIHPVLGSNTAILPNLNDVVIAQKSMPELLTFLADLAQISITSAGPTSDDRTMHNLPFHKV